VGEKFSAQLNAFFRENTDISENNALQERIKAAAAYFIPENETLLSRIRQSPAVTDSKLHSKEYNDQVKELYSRLAEKQYLLEGLRSGFEPDTFMLYRSNFIVPPFSVNAYAGANTKKSESPHPVLHQQLRKLRDSICAKKDIPIYLVAGSNTLDELARYLPHDLQEIRMISGFGEAKTEQYGQQFLDIILGYCQANQFTSLIHEKVAKRERKQSGVASAVKEPGSKKKGETYAETFRLFREGKDIITIAAERKLAVGTIESHLNRFIESGDIKIEELVSPEKLSLIESAFKDYNGNTITPVKQKLGDAVSFGEIRWAMVSLGIVQSAGTD
jgi:Helix-turn-helix domain/HRDC domain